MDRDQYRRQHNQRVQGYRDQGKLTPEELAAATGKRTVAYPGFMPEGAMTEEELQRMADLADGTAKTPGTMTEEELDRIAAMAGGGRR